MVTLSGDDAREMRELFKQGYRGSRFSFGYPACPHMEDQAIRWDLLGATNIGIEMGEEFQLVLEHSTSALVCHHPGTKYFTNTVLATAAEIDRRVSANFWGLTRSVRRRSS